MALPPLLVELLRAPGPPGREDAVARIVRREAAALGAVVEGDVLGSTLARLRGRGDGRTLALVAHADQVGLGITRFDEDGRARAGPLGSWEAAAAVGQRFRVLTASGEVPAVGLRVGNDGTPTWADIRLDLGASDPSTASALASVGDPAVLDCPPAELAYGRLTATGLDNRLGVYAALEALRVLAAELPSWDVVLLASVQEETGTHGGAAAAATARLRPDAAIVVECTYASDAPSGPAPWGDVGLGGGPAVMRGPVVHPAIADGLIGLAAEVGIGVAVETGNSTWCDADNVFAVGEGIAVGLLSIPVRHMHTASEIAQLTDVEALTGLLVAYARSLADDVSFMR